MNGNMMSEEAGATDNILQWNPSEMKVGEDWQDGEEYTVTLRIKQTSPGEAQVISMTAAGGAEPEPAGETEPVISDETPVMAEASQNTNYSNPAIAKMMGGPKR